MSEKTDKTEQQRLSVFKTYKLYVGGKFPRSESGRVYEVTDSRASGWPTRRSPPARTPVTRWSPPARRSAAGPARRRTTAVRSSTASPRCWRAARTSSSVRSRTRRACRSPRPPRSSTRRSTAGSGTRAGPTRSPRWWAAATRSRVLLQPVHPGADGRRHRPRAPGVVLPRPGLGDRPGDRDRQHGDRDREREVPAPGAVSGRGAGDLRPSGRCRQRPLRKDGGDRGALAAHQDVNAIDLAGADDVLAKELEIAAADNLKRVVRPQAVDYSRTPGIERLTAFLETKTVWHPTGALGASGSSY